jgi:prepilin-type N-terminal cleavage/methylation domain-containing protein
MTSLNNIKNSKKGFNIIELIVVAAISAVLLSAVGLTVFYFQRNALGVEQVAQELSGEIRVLQSKILAVQNVGGFIPKALAVELKLNTDPIVHYYRYIGGANCTRYTSMPIEISNRGSIKEINSTSVGSLSSVYLSYVSPSANFTVVSSSTPPTFSYRAIDGSCNPLGTIISSGTIIVDITNGSQDYYIKVDAKNGSVTPTPNP